MKKSFVPTWAGLPNFDTFVAMTRNAPIESNMKKKEKKSFSVPNSYIKKSKFLFLKANNLLTSVCQDRKSLPIGFHDIEE